MKDSKQNTLITPCAEVWMDNGILYVKYLPIVATLEQAKEHIDLLRTKFTEELPVLSLSDITQVKQSDKEVRNYLASDEVAEMVKASAIITGSGLSKIVGNLFLKFSAPKYPTRIFSKEEKAIEWLLSRK